MNQRQEKQKYVAIPRIELRTSDLLVRCPTDCATRPGLLCDEPSYPVRGQVLFSIYRKNSKNWDTLNYYRDCPTNVIVGFYSAILRSKDADRITNRVDTDQTAP